MVISIHEFKTYKYKRMDYLIGVFVIALLLTTIYKHNKDIKKHKVQKLRHYKSDINNALTLYDCLFIHIELHSEKFITHDLSLDKVKVHHFELTAASVFCNGSSVSFIENHYESDSPVYKTALETYKSALNNKVDSELHKYK